MKKIITLAALSLIATGAWTQDNTATGTVDNENMVPKKSKISKPSRDFVMLQLGYESWNNTPDSINITGLGRGFNAYLCYDFPIAKSNFSFAAGLGVANSNVYFKNQIPVLSSVTSYISFTNVDPTLEDQYKRSKLSLTYLEAPFELRFFGNKENRNRGFKMAVGMKVGLLMNVHSKVRHSLAGPYINEKEVANRYAQKWRFVPTARIGWGNFSIYGSYSLTQLFTAGSGPEVYPFSVGICISGL